MKSGFLFCLGVCAAILAGCDDDKATGSEYNGFYCITAFQERASCDDADPWQDRTPDAPCFSLNAENFFGTPILAWRNCTGNTPDTCDDSVSLTESFVRVDGTWMQSMDSASGQNGGSCQLSSRRGLLAKTADGIEVTTTTRAGVVSLPAGSACDTDRVEEYEDSLDCTGMQRLTAQKR